MTLNFSERSNSLFTNTAYASMCFRLNRDDPQYSSGVPNVKFYLEGMKISTVIRNGTAGNYTYSISPEKSYSNNPALVLLDYLTSTRYGRGLSTNFLDLESFYNAAQICGTIVQTNSPVSGKLWKGKGVSTRDIPRFEFNGVLNTEKSIRDNVETILSSMGDADLVWSGGIYKLQLQYPVSLENTIVVGTITDNELVRGIVDIVYPSASDRLNYCTATFSNEAEDFSNDSVYFPSKNSSIYQQMLSQDNGFLLEDSISLEGVTDKAHALAMAEERVRTSRSKATYSFSIRLGSEFYEPGDIIILDSQVTGISNEYLKITSVQLNSNGDAEIVATKYDPTVFAWNAKDNEIVIPRNNYSFIVQPPSNVTYVSALSNELTSGGLGTISWDPPTDAEPTSYVVEYTRNNGASFVKLGESTGAGFEVGSLTAGEYRFSVRAKNT
jgi:predicted phage tail protein